jgi:hypothetical protein
LIFRKLICDSLNVCPNLLNFPPDNIFKPFRETGCDAWHYVIFTQSTECYEM